MPRKRAAALHMPVEQVAAPTPDLARHHDIAQRAVTGDRRHAFKIKSRVEGLLLAGRIDEAQGWACERFYQDWAYGLHGVRERPLIRIAGSALPGPNDRQLDALAAFHAACEAVGRYQAALLIWCACEDQSWRLIGRRLGMKHGTAAMHTVRAIVALAQHYHAADNAQRRGA